MAKSTDTLAIFHLGYVVRDMAIAVRKWEHMGARIIVPPTIDPIQNVTCALLNYKTAVPIELVSPADNGANPLKSRLAKGGGLDHICLFSDDVAADLTVAVAEGGVVAVPPSYGAVFDRVIAFVVTRPGLVVEYMSRQAVGRATIDPLSPWLARSRSGSSDGIPFG